MALSSSSKPYTSLSATDDEDETNHDVELSSPNNGYRDDPINDEEEPYADDIAVQPLELEAASANNRRRIHRCYALALVVGGIVVLSALAGGKYYYDNGGEVPSFVSNFFGAGRGDTDDADDRMGDSGGVRGSPNGDYSIAQELFEGANDNEDGMVISANGGQDGEIEMSQDVLDEELDETESSVEEVPNQEVEGEEDESDDEEEDQSEQEEDVSGQNESMEDIEQEQTTKQTMPTATYVIMDQVTHDATSFTQGLSYGNDGMIYESTGLYGNSKLHKINPESFEVESSVDIERKYFGEGSTFFTDSDGNARIIEITWKEQTGFIYDANTLERLSTFQYTTTAPHHEGWGITYDESNQQFIVSDGSSYLYFWDRDTFQERRKVEVTRTNGQTQNMLNELEFMDGLVCCNIWHSDDIICVDPTTGKSAREYDMSSLWPKNERGGSENVLNGIALGKDHVLITGKRWDRMYKVTFADWPSLFAAEVVLGSKYPILESTSVQGSDPEQSNFETLEQGEEVLPDYFVPLTPDERKQLKDRLRSILYTTDNSLHLSASPSSDRSKVLPQRTFVIDPKFPKQFMHMHHMKTGGTSMDSLIHCALQRQLHFHGDKAIKYSSMSECGSAVRMCMDKLASGLNATVINNVFFQNDEEGKPITDAPFDPAIGEFENTVGDLNVCQTSDCGVMSYCASLHTVRTFGWKDVDKITVIRNPIDRAWSMYRFTLQSCYHCKELKDVLIEVANGTFIGRGEIVNDGQTSNFVYDPADSCAVQMIGHQATNLLSSIDLYNVANDVRFPREREIVEEAVKNLRESFTWIGITDRLAESVDGFRTIFPFLAENLTEAMLSTSQRFQANGLQDVDFSFPDGYIDTNGCPFGHKNEGRDPSCGTKELDDEIIHLILKLNNRDMAVYQAAVERFELQMEVLEEYRASRI
eukprot:CCRYP_005283-RA/>CCRYP_005283-RA protein AED:0.21 eAED:0.21 QI:0/0.66/0.5/1/0.33/0.25/4/85/927